MFLKHVRILDIVLVIMLALFSFSLINTLVYNDNIKTIQRLSNNFYGENSLIFSTEKHDYAFETVYSILPSDTALYGVIQSLGRDIRLVSYKGTYTPPSLSSGRFFTEEDFTGNNFLAVTGKEVAPSFTEKGKNYIQIDGLEYEIIGIIEYSMPTRLDNSIFLTANNSNFLLADKYIISGKELQESYNFLGYEELFGQVSARYYNGVNILHIIDRNSNQLILSVLFLIVLFINNISIIHLWTEYQKREVKIKLKNGFLRYQIILDLCRKYLFIFLCSTILSIPTSVLFLVGIQNYTLKIPVILISLTASFCCPCIFLIFFCICLLKKRKGEDKYDPVAGIGFSENA